VKWMTLLLLGAMGLTVLGQPQGSFRVQDNRYVIVVGETVVLEDTIITDEALRYFWDLGDGRKAQGLYPSVAYDEPGAYRVTLTVETEAGVADDTPFSRWIFVNDPDWFLDPARIPPYPFLNEPAHGAAFAVDEEICFQGYGFEPQDQAVTLYWDFDDGETAEGVAEPKKAYSQPGEYEPKLFARDETGFTQVNLAFIGLSVYLDRRPPDAAILSPVVNNPERNAFELAAGEAFRLRGVLTESDPDYAPYGAVWRVYAENGDFWEIEGLEPEPQRWPAGYYDVFLQVYDRDGRADPYPPSIAVWIRDDNRAPRDVAILTPSYDLTLLPGDGLELSGAARDPDGDALRFVWKLSDGRCLEGGQVDRVVFEEPGLYGVSLTAIDAFGAETMAPRQVYVSVLPPDCGEPAPDLAPVAPVQADLSGPAGAVFAFEVGLDANTAATEWFWDFGNGDFAAGPSPDPIRFNQPGWHPVRVFARNECGAWSGEALWSVFIYGDDIPPDGRILEPARNAVSARNERVASVAVGQELTLIAEAEDADGQFPLITRWWLDGAFYQSGLEPEPLVFAEPGRHFLEFFVTDNAGVDDPFAANRQVIAVDPSQTPESSIVHPEGAFTAEPGQPVSFEGFGVDPNGLAVSYEWDFGPNAEPAAATGPWVPAVRFTEPSPPGEPYIVRLWVSTPFARQSEPATAAIEVKTTPDEALEPNDSLDQAASLNQGDYSQLTLGDDDAADVFVFETSRDARDIAVTLAADAPLAAELFRREDETWLPFPTESEPSPTLALTLEDLPAGDYALRVQPADSAKRRATLGYSLGLRTLRPSLYLPFVVEDGALTATVGLVNPNPEPAYAQLVGLNAAGENTATATVELAPGQWAGLSGATLFGAREGLPESRRVTWIRVLSDLRLAGYVNGRSQDGLQLMSAAGQRTLSPKAIAPHIAVPANGWYTRAVVVNALQREGALRFAAPDAELAIADPAAANSQQDFRFSERLPPALPEWGAFANPGGEAALAGVEIFGRTDLNRQMAAIELIDLRRTNPNFTYIGNDLYFTHIASDTDNWWTGASLINTGDVESRYNLIGYGADGQPLVVLENQSLPVGGKLLRTATQLFGDQPVAWMKVEGEGALAGFELFGDPGRRRLAGFPAAAALTDRLLFPHLENEPGRAWTGLALLNVAAEPVNLTFVAYDATGEPLAQSSRRLGPRAKLVALAEDLLELDSLPAGAAYIVASGDRKTLCGFELFGDFDEAGGLGDRLAGLGAIGL